MCQSSSQVGKVNLFYNGSSKWDPKPDPTVANIVDFGAIAIDKVPLLPNRTATFANYSSYYHGVNGILIQFVGLPATATFSASDFAFSVGNDNNSDAWAAAPAPTSVSAIVGPDGTVYAAIIFPDASIMGQWLKTKVLVTPNTQLGSEYTFYFGAAMGETGDRTSDAIVDATDITLTQSNQTGRGSATITNHFDFNRDGKVDAADITLAQMGQSGANPLQLITVPPVSSLLYTWQR